MTRPARPAGGARSLAALALALAGLQCAAQTAAPRQQFDIASGPLGDVLLQIGRTAGVLVSFSPGLARHVQAPAIRGSYTVMEALVLATRASGLAAEVTGGGTVTISPAQVAPAAVAVAQPSPLGSAAGATAAQGVVVLPPVEVLGTGRQQEDGLKALRSSSALRTDTLLVDLPQAVSVLTSDALQIQGGASSSDALRYISGASSRIDSAGGQGVVPSLLVRGLPAVFAMSGMGTIRAGLPMDSAFIERIEVPKGPSVTIPGVSSFGGRGGVVNLVRKEAGVAPQRDVLQSTSSRDSGTGRLEADLAGRLTDDVSWRLVSAGVATGTADGGYAQRGGGGGVLASGRFSSGDTVATVTAQADRSQIVPARVAQGGSLQQDGSITPILPGEAAPADPNDRFRVGSADVGLTLDWRVAPRWRLNLKTRVEAVDTDLRLHAGGLFTLDGRRTSWWNAALQAGLVGDVDLGPMRHRLLLGVDLSQWRVRLQDARFAPGDLSALGRVDARDVKRELLLQDQVRIGPLRGHLAAQLARVPVFDQNGVGTGEAQLNWDAGVVYRLAPEVSVYAGGQRSVETDVIRTIGRALALGATEATSTRQTQAGLKLDLLEDRLAFTLEAFATEQVNYPAFNGAAANPFVFFPLRSVRGLELDLSGRPYAGFDLQAGMSFMHAVDQVNIAAGGRPALVVPAAAVPQRSMHLLARAQLPGQWFPQTSLGVAFRARSSSFAVPPDPQVPGLQLVLPGSADLSLSLERRVGNWSFSAFVRNLFDRDVYESQSVPGAIPLEPGRSIGLSASWKGGLRP